jgi:hypothetical protein
MTSVLGWWKSEEPQIRSYVKGFTAWLSTMLIQVLSAGIDAAVSWTWKQWAARLGVAALMGFVGLVPSRSPLVRSDP